MKVEYTIPQGPSDDYTIRPALVSVEKVITPNHSDRRGHEPRLIVLHSAECGESSEAAENLASWGAGASRPKASWHFAVDNDSITQSVEIGRKAWHAGVVNPYSIGIEQAGRASQTRNQWFDDYSGDMLDRMAELVAYLCFEYSIPVRVLSLEELSKGHRTGGARGITTHHSVTKAFKVRGGHVDPGPGYPMDWVLGRIEMHLNFAGWELDSNGEILGRD